MSEKKKAEQELSEDEYQKALHDDYDFLSQAPVPEAPKQQQTATPPNAEDLYDYYEGYWYGKADNG